MTTTTPTPPRFAPVIPFNLAEILAGWRVPGNLNALGDYHLLLAHDVVANPDGYRNVYHPLQGEHVVKIMDNSVVELGEPMTGEDMAEAVKIAGATAVVLPDVLLDGYATVECAICYRRKWEDTMPHGVEYMVIPQGETFEEWLHCFTELKAHVEFDWIGIPRNLRRVTGISRSDACKAIELEYPHINTRPKVHLFGFSGDMFDDFKTCLEHPWVRGIDSNLPIRLALEGNSLDLGTKYGGRNESSWDWETQSKIIEADLVPMKERIYFNLWRCREWLTGVSN